MTRKMFNLKSTTRRLVQRLAQRLAKEDSGTELMEAAAIFPLLFMIFLGIFWFGQAFTMYGTITRAAQDGARAGAAPTCSTCNTGNSPAQNAYNAVVADFTIANLNIANAQQLSTQPSFNSCNTTLPNCDTTIGPQICVQQPVYLTNAPPGGPGVCGVAVSFQYPYQFWLPFTSLNKTQIWLKAQARVRIETQ
jgi:Flp pilus assembly protein TadG